MNFLHHLFNLCIFNMSIDFSKLSPTMKSKQSIDVPKESDLNLSQSEIDKITNLRENVIYNTSTKYKPGDVIYNARDKEVGFIVGKHPERSILGSGVVYFIISRRSDNGEVGVRYLQEKFIVPVQSANDGIPKGGVLNDFCNNYCIMDCSDCPLKSKGSKK